jgi:hypothetical protein
MDAFFRNSVTEVCLSLDSNKALDLARVRSPSRPLRLRAVRKAPQRPPLLPKPAAKPIESWRLLLANPGLLKEAEANYRRRMLTAHPDVGGEPALAAWLNAAIETARSILS